MSINAQQVILNAYLLNMICMHLELLGGINIHIQNPMIILIRIL